MNKSKWVPVFSVFCLTMALLGCGSNGAKSNESQASASKASEAVPKQEISIEASFPKYSSLGELENQADLIVEGRILSSTFQFLNVAQKPSDPADAQLNPGTDPADSPLIPYTIYDVQIQKVYKGEVTEKETIQVKQVGGENQKTIFKVNDSTGLKMNGDYIMFLATYDHSPASLLNPIQASYQLVDDQIVASDKNTIKLNFKDLKQLTESSSMK